MRLSPGVVLIAASAAILLLRSNVAQAMTSIEDQDTSDAPREADSNPEYNPPIEFDYEWNPGYNGEYSGETEAQIVDRRIKAFLYMIRACEHVYPRDVDNNACYHIFYGGSNFRDYSDHPVLTGEKVGIPLSDAVCAAAGLGPGCVSTAAGAYQIIKGTWQRVREIAPRLPDFSPQSQDWAAIRLLQESGALRHITAGDIPRAVQAASRLWASLPGSTAEQNPKRVQYAMDRYNEGMAA